MPNGDLYSLLQKTKGFNEHAVRFILAEVEKKKKLIFFFFKSLCVKKFKNIQNIYYFQSKTDLIKTQR